MTLEAEAQDMERTLTLKWFKSTIASSTSYLFTTLW